MALARMLSTTISMSEKVSELSAEAALLYTWMIPHADDLGFLQGSPKTVRAVVVPMMNWSVEQVGIQLESIRIQGLIRWIQYDGKAYYYIVDFDSHQTLKKDRQPQTILPFTRGENAKENWVQAELLRKTVLESKLDDLGSTAAPVGIQLEPEVKVNEGKVKEEIIPNGIMVANDQTSESDNAEKATDPRNPYVNLILDQFTLVFTFSPTDKKPRQVAYNLWQKLCSYFKAKAIDPEETKTVEGRTTTRMQLAIEAYFDWVGKQEWSEGIQKLETVKLKLPIWEASLKL